MACMSDEILVFDRAAFRAHRQRGARLPADMRFLTEEIRHRLVDRLLDVKGSFTAALALGAGDGTLAEMLAEADRRPRLVSLDASFEFARKSPCAVVADEEALPFADNSFDLIIGTLGLHWTNDLPGALLQLRRALRPDGLLLASMYGGKTLWELREALTLAELEITGGAAPRVSPFADVRDLGGLLQRARFALPVVDTETLTVTYPNLFALMTDLRASGDTNALRDRPRHFTRRSVMLRAAEIYRDRFGDAAGRIPASFQVITLTGWSPDESQPKPLRPGSATMRLADGLGTEEITTGDPARPKA
jgi:SAM-dependent methyltransferase